MTSGAWAACPGAGAEIDQLLIRLLGPERVGGLGLAQRDRHFPRLGLAAHRPFDRDRAGVVDPAEVVGQPVLQDAAGIDRGGDELALEHELALNDAGALGHGERGHPETHREFDHHEAVAGRFLQVCRDKASGAHHLGEAHGGAHVGWDHAGAGPGGGGNDGVHGLNPS